MSRPSASSLACAARLVAALLLAVISLAAEARTRPRYGGVLRVEVEGDPLEAGGLASRLIFDGLTRIDAGGNPQPSLALRWSSENDHHRWQFWLRPGVTLHNGRPLNAPTVAASLEQSCQKIACPWSSLHITGNSIILNADNPIPDLPALLASDRFLIRQTSEQETGGAAAAIGTGPYRIGQTNPNGVLLEADNDCWQGRPFVDTIEILAHRSPRDQFADLAANKADVVEVRPSDLRQGRQQRLIVLESPAAMLLELEIHATTLSPQLRTALALAVDRAALFQVIFQKQGEITASLLPNALTGYSFLFPAERDVPQALALRGGITPPPLTLSVEGTGPIQLAAERLALNLRDAGFNIKVASSPHPDLLLRSIPMPEGSPSEVLDQLLRGFGDPLPVIAPDEAATYKAEHDFLEQHAVVPLLFLPRAWAISSRLRDVRLTADGLPDLANASLTEGAP